MQQTQKQKPVTGRVEAKKLLSCQRQLEYKYDRITMHAIVAAAYPQSTFNGTLTCSNLGGTASFKTYVADQETRKNQDVYVCKFR